MIVRDGRSLVSRWGLLRLGAVLLVLATAWTTLAPGVGAQGADEGSDPAGASRPGRVLVFSVPGLSWGDLRRHDLPALRGVVDRGAVASLAPRGVFARSGPGDAYLTISGGSRATTDRSIDGQVLALDETSAGSAAGEIFQRRTGTEPTGPFVSLTWPALVRLNDAQPYDTEPGLLTETLQAAGVSAAAIGNADGVDSVGDSFERQAGLALADANGVVPAGSLGKDLLVDDPSQPFGVRLDRTLVEQEFSAAWRDAAPTEASNGGVVLVEASDLARTLRYRPIVDFARYGELWAEALQQTDALLAALLRSVDLETDTVLVVAPYNKRGDRDLVVTALAGPEVAPGYLRSASTQRSGYLTLVDIGPTILDQFAIDRPVEMEGRPAVVVPSSASGDARIDRLVSDNEASRFREQLLTPTSVFIVVGLAIVLALAIATHANRWRRRVRVLVSSGGLVVLLAMPTSYLATAFPVESWGTSFYWAFLLGVSVAVTLVVQVVAHRRSLPRMPLHVVLGTVALVLVVDVMTGSNLSLNAAFGYSPTGNSRLYGISNYSYGQLAAATCLLAASLAWWRPGPRGVRLGVTAMVATLVVLGVPIWGSDVGGVLAFTPAVAAYWAVVTRRRIRLRTAVAATGATAVAIGLFAVLDLTRSPADRGHLGRLFERLGSEGVAPLLSLVERKLAANLDVSTSSVWVLAIPLGAAFWVFLRRYPDHPYRQLLGRFATLPAGLVAALVAGVLGSLLNDSGAIIAGVVVTVVAASLAVLSMEGPPPPDRRSPTEGPGAG